MQSSSRKNGEENLTVSEEPSRALVRSTVDIERERERVKRFWPDYILEWGGVG